MLSATLYHQLSLSVSNSSCTSIDSEACRDDSAALTLKLIAIGSILVAGITGIGIPLIGKNRRFLGTDSNLFVATKAFAAGVILATGFVHMLPDGSSNLTNSCLPAYPWSKFPFAGFCAMVSALLTLVADFVGTQYYERKQKRGKKEALAAGSGDEHGRDGSLDSVSESGIMPVDRVVSKEKDGGGKRDRVFGEEEDGGLPVVGMHAHSAEHRHSHPPPRRGGKTGNEAAGVVVDIDGEEEDGHGHDHGHGHSHGFGGGEDDGGRHAVVSQVLELGIVSHSVIIGLSLGVSHSPCTIRPLLAALSFHQFFEGFALGGCISQAQFKKTSTVVMACFFAITTPSGIAAGIGLASFYNPESARALAIEGILDSVSAGILIYMSLVDLIAADFMSKKMRCNIRLQIVSYFALFLGATVMSSLAIWS